MHLAARCTVAVFLAATMFLAAHDAAAANQSWAVSSGNWATASNWSGGLAPSATNAAYIVNGGTATIAQGGEACQKLTLGNGAASGTIVMVSGSLFDSDISFPEIIGTSGTGSSGSFVQSGGTHSAAYGISLGNYGGASGAYNLVNGSLSTPILTVGNSGPGSFVQSGGIVTLSSTLSSVSPELNVGYDDGGSGTYTLSAGGLLSAPLENIGGGYASGSATFTQSGGTNNTGSQGIVLAGAESSAGTYNLNGGLLILSSLSQGSGSASFNFNGGTLQSTAASSIDVPILLGSGGSGAVFDTGGGTLAVSDDLSGGGSLTKSGAGLLILSGSDSYSGGTIVAVGTLEAASADALPPGGSLTVSADGTLIFDPSIAAAPLASSSGLAIASVPEPSTLALLVVGAAGLLGYIWRRRKQTA